MRLIDFAPLAIAALFCAAPVVQRGMMTAAQPFRLKLAEKGEALLARTDVPADLREDVESMLADPFPCNCLFMFLIVPLVPLFMLLSMSSAFARTTNRAASQEVMGRYAELHGIYRRISLANHPIATPVTEFLATMTLVVVAPFYLLIKRGAASLDRDGAVLALERQQRHLLHPMRRVA